MSTIWRVELHVAQGQPIFRVWYVESVLCDSCVFVAAGRKTASSKWLCSIPDGMEDVVFAWCEGTQEVIMEEDWLEKTWREEGKALRKRMMASPEGAAMLWFPSMANTNGWLGYSLQFPIYEQSVLGAFPYFWCFQYQGE